MAASGSVPWIRSDVTTDDPVWQKETSVQFKYPPLRFFSRHTPCDPGCPTGNDCNDCMTSGPAISPDDGGSDVSISSADTVIAAPSLADKLANGVRANNSQSETEISDTKYVDNNSKHGGYLDHCVNHVDSYLRHQEALPGEHRAAFTDTDDVTDHMTTDGQLAAGRERVNGSPEHVRSGNTSYFTVEYVDRDDDIGGDSPLDDVIVTSTGTGSVADKRVPIGRHRDDNRTTELRRSVEQKADNSQRPRDCEGVNKTSEGGRRAEVHDDTTAGSCEKASCSSELVRRSGDTEVNSTNTATVPNCEGAYVMSGYSGPASVVTCNTGVYDTHNNRLYGGSTKAAYDGVQRNNNRTSPVCGVVVSSEDHHPVAGDNQFELRPEFVELRVAESAMIRSGDDVIVGEKRTSFGEQLATENLGEVITTSTAADRLGYETLAGRKHWSESPSGRTQSEFGDHVIACRDGSPPATSVQNGVGMPGMRYAEAPSQRDDEGIGEETMAGHGIIGQHRSVAGLQLADNPSDNSSVDSEVTSYRKKSALKSAAASTSTSNKDSDAKRTIRKVRFAEPLVVRDNPPEGVGVGALSARERLGLSKDDAITLGHGVMMRPRIQYVQKNDAGGDGVTARGRSEPDRSRPDAAPRYVIKRGPPVKRLAALSATRGDCADDVNDDHVYSGSASQPGTRKASSANKSDYGNRTNLGANDSGPNGTRDASPETKPRSGAAESWYRGCTGDAETLYREQSTTGSDCGNNPKTKSRVTLTRSNPIARNRSKPSPELRRRPSPPPETTSTSDDVIKVPLTREIPLRSSAGNHQVHYGTGHAPELASGVGGSGAEVVPTYAKPRRDCGTSGAGTAHQRSSQPAYVTALSYDDVTQGTLNGYGSSSAYGQNARFSGGVPELAVIPHQSDSPSVPSPVSGDSGISSSSSVTDLNRDQAFGTVTTADGPSDGYNGPNCTGNDKTRAVPTRVYETEEPRPDVGETRSHHRPAGREIRDETDASRNVMDRDAISASVVVRRASGRNGRRGHVISATENRENSDLGQWSRAMDQMAKDDVSVRYMTSGRQQNGGLRFDEARNSIREGYNERVKGQETSPGDMTSSRGYYSAQQQQQQQQQQTTKGQGQGVYRDVEYNSYRDSDTGQLEENPYGRFLRSATNRKSSRGRLVPIPLDILDPRAASRTESRPDVGDSWSRGYVRSGDDFRRMSNSSGYSTQDISYDMANSPDCYVIGADSRSDNGSVGRHSLSFDKPEPRFTTTAQIYQLLREKSRNPFVKTNGFT